MNKCSEYLRNKGIFEDINIEIKFFLPANRENKVVRPNQIKYMQISKSKL